MEAPPQFGGQQMEFPGTQSTGFSQQSFQPQGAQQSFQPQGAQQNFQPQGAQQSFQPQGAQQSFQPQGAQQSFQPQSFQPQGAQQSFQPQSFQPQSFQPQGVQQSFQPQGVRQSFQPQGVQQSFQPQGAQQSFQPQSFQPQGLQQSFQPQSFQPQSFQPQSFQPQGVQQSFQPQSSQYPGQFPPTQMINTAPGQMPALSQIIPRFASTMTQTPGIGFSGGVVQPGGAVSTPVTPSGPRKPQIPIWTQPTPFSAEEIAELQRTKIPFNKPIYFPPPACQTCRAVISSDDFQQYREMVDSGMDDAIALDALDILRPCCRLNFFKPSEIPRGRYLLPEEKQSGNLVNISPAGVVVETQQRPIRPPAGGKIRVISTSTLKVTLKDPTPNKYAVVYDANGKADSVKMLKPNSEYAPGPNERIVTATSGNQAMKTTISVP